MGVYRNFLLIEEVEKLFGKATASLMKKVPNIHVFGAKEEVFFKKAEEHWVLKAYSAPLLCCPLTNITHLTHPCASVIGKAFVQSPTKVFTLDLNHDSEQTFSLSQCLTTWIWGLSLLEWKIMIYSERFCDTIVKIVLETFFTAHRPVTFSRKFSRSIDMEFGYNAITFLFALTMVFDIDLLHN